MPPSAGLLSLNAEGVDELDAEEDRGAAPEGVPLEVALPVAPPAAGELDPGEEPGVEVPVLLPPLAGAKGFVLEFGGGADGAEGGAGPGGAEGPPIAAGALKGPELGGAWATSRPPMLMTTATT